MKINRYKLFIVSAENGVSCGNSRNVLRILSLHQVLLHFQLALLRLCVQNNLSVVSQWKWTPSPSIYLRKQSGVLLLPTLIAFVKVHGWRNKMDWESFVLMNGKELELYLKALATRLQCLLHCTVQYLYLVSETFFALYHWINICPSRAPLFSIFGNYLLYVSVVEVETWPNVEELKIKLGYTLPELRL